MKKKRSKSAGGSRNVSDEGIKILFLCTKNQRRSPTAEKTWNRRAGVSARSAGISLLCKNPLSAKDIRWAEYILVMEERHKTRLFDEFPRLLKDKKVHVLNVSEGQGFMSPELVAHFELIVSDIIYPK